MAEQGGRQAPGVEALADKVKQLVHEGNTRRVVVRNAEGEPVLDIPVTAGVVAAVAAPVVTAVAALAALAGPWSLGVERSPEAGTAEAGTAEADSSDVEPTAAEPTDGGASAAEAGGTTPPPEGRGAAPRS
ncbi:uncharacterized protein DUF4342 [Saccharothrix saharensis]|uniref:Uncharacterized protein DUF4342 n=1 Tax=Saccharothrix saharensis TaxID=571190 RepID=A0A543J7E1_9PSEU|nr:DUF4342 domain-containing protein [Saccharothrix saharensis]TQM78745.1 uncharacterized protein DUF4342 [Saccharothrix saharensis]